MNQLIPPQVKIIDNPDQEELRELSLKHGLATMKSHYGNILKLTRNKARKAEWTYIIAPPSESSNYSSKVITAHHAGELIEQAKTYMVEQGIMIRIDGYIGIGERAVGVTWFYDLEVSNIAGMQQVLAFPREMVETPEQLEKPFNNQLTLVFTAGARAVGMPGDQAIIVDLENYVTHVIGPDYFGESKKGELRMFNEYVYQRGGLVLHAGAKVVKLEEKKISVAIMGLSGTGKTTTTFSRQGEGTEPIQDDMIALWPDGTFSITENGCFAKTYGLTEQSEPVIYRGTVHPDAWIENVFPNSDGTYDFSKDTLSPEEVGRLKKMLQLTGSSEENLNKYISGEVNSSEVVDEYMIPQDGWDFVVWTQNGRSIIPMTAIENAADFEKLPDLGSLGILNRDEGSDAATPGIVLFSSPEQAAGYFMLGETSKTSAAGKERGKTRSPFTQPFFPRNHSLQPVRFKQLLANFSHLQTWLMNTGYIGGDARDLELGKALKVKIRHSSAMLEALFKNIIKWKLDPDFNYYIVDVDNSENKSLIEQVPVEILNPIIYFKNNHREEEYRNWVQRMKQAREKFLRQYNVDPKIIQAVIN